MEGSLDFFFFQNLVTFAIAAIFVICVLASMKNPCYFCGICGHFGVLFGFFFSKVMNLVKFVTLSLFATFVRGVLRTVSGHFVPWSDHSKSDRSTK